MKRSAALPATAAVVLLVAGVASALVVGKDDHRITRSGALSPTSTSSTTTAGGTGSMPGTEPAGPAVSIPTQLISSTRLQPFRTCGSVVDYARAKALDVVTPYRLPGALDGAAYAGPPPI